MDERQQQTLARLRELRAGYADWHRTGMDALERGDWQALDAAVRAESDIIQEQMRLLSELKGWAS
jgi:hypothetical protein